MKVYGPYLRKDGRKHVVIVYLDGTKKTKSYPKFLLENKIGRELVNDETCDHIDGDFTNDDPNNLQVLSLPKNIIKSKKETQYYVFVCSECNQQTKKPMYAVKHNWNLGKSGPYCSRSCAGKINQRKKKS